MKKSGNASVHDELKGFNIKINKFGEMETNLPIDKLNKFLNDKVQDKKINDSEEE